MIVYKDIIQQTEEWFKIKHGKIGGTRAKGLFTKGDTLFYELLSEHQEDWFDEGQFVTTAMLRGNELEGPALLELSRRVFVDLKFVGWCQSEVNELLGISPDGISADGTIMAEIKCPGGKKHVETFMRDMIPSDNIHQAIHYFTVNDKLQTLLWCSYRPENRVCPLYIHELTRESVVNIGTEARPVMKPISECVETAYVEAGKLLDQISNNLK